MLDRIAHIKWPLQDVDGTEIHIVCNDTVMIHRPEKSPKQIGRFHIQNDGKLVLKKTGLNDKEHFFRKYQAYAEQKLLVDALPNDAFIACYIGSTVYYESVKTWRENSRVDEYNYGIQYFLRRDNMKRKKLIG